jgi:hypothetical protein
MTDMVFSSKEAALAFGSGLAAHEQRETFHGFPRFARLSGERYRGKPGFPSVTSLPRLVFFTECPTSPTRC